MTSHFGTAAAALPAMGASIAVAEAATVALDLTESDSGETTVLSDVLGIGMTATPDLTAIPGRSRTMPSQRRARVNRAVRANLARPP